MNAEYLLIWLKQFYLPDLLHLKCFQELIAHMIYKYILNGSNIEFSPIREPLACHLVPVSR